MCEFLQKVSFLCLLSGHVVPCLGHTVSLFQTFALRFFCCRDFLWGIEEAHLVSSILRGSLVNFDLLGLCFASVCADAQKL